MNNYTLHYSGGKALGPIELLAALLIFFFKNGNADMLVSMLM